MLLSNEPKIAGLLFANKMGQHNKIWNKTKERQALAPFLQVMKKEESISNITQQNKLTLIRKNKEKLNKKNFKNRN